MKFPNKVTGINDSIIFSALMILKKLSLQPFTVWDLFKVSKIKDITQFVDALTFLYAIDKIKLNQEKELELC